MAKRTRRIDQYALLDEVYADGLSVVCRARGPDRGRVVWLRTIAPHLA